MSDQYPPQQPGFQPQGGPTSPNPYDSSSQQPYGQQASQPYGQPTPNPYGQQASQPYGQPAAQPYGQQAPNPYGQPSLQPYGQPVGPYGPQRPGPATGASVLGIVSGGLGIIAGFFAIAFVSTFQGLGSLAANLGLLVTLSYIQAFGTFIAAVALLVGGIMFLKGKGYPVLLYGAFGQAALTLLNLLIRLFLPQILGLNSLPSVVSSSIGLDGGTVLNALIGFGLSGSTIYLLFTPVAKRWKQ